MKARKNYVCQACKKVILKKGEDMYMEVRYAYEPYPGRNQPHDMYFCDDTCAADWYTEEVNLEDQ
jgi:uncharacterized protein YlaI